jgi:hypothetical protein
MQRVSPALHECQRPARIAPHNNAVQLPKGRAAREQKAPGLPYRNRVATADHRPGIHLQILENRRHPFACAFSPRRMAVQGFDRVLKGKAEKNASGDAVNFSAGKRGSYGAQ